MDFVPGMELNMVGRAGLAGTLSLMREREEELSQQMNPDLLTAFCRQAEEELSFLKQAEAELSLLQKAETVRIQGVLLEDPGLAIYPVKEEGILQALWNGSESSHVGLTISYPAIPVWQACIEICECLSVNPYLIACGGCLLVGCRPGQTAWKETVPKGILSTIGRITAGRDRVLLWDDRRVYLSPPKRMEREWSLSSIGMSRTPVRER